MWWLHRLGWTEADLKLILQVCRTNPTSINTLEQCHSFRGRLVKYHTQLTHPLLRNRGHIAEMRSLVMPDPCDTRLDRLCSEKLRLERMVPARCSTAASFKGFMLTALADKRHLEGKAVTRYENDGGSW